MKEEIDNSSIIVGDFSIPHSTLDGTSWQKSKREIEDWNNVVNQLLLIDVCRIFYLTAAESIFFSNEHGTFSRLDHTPGHKTSLDKFKVIELYKTSFPTTMALN